MPTSPDKTCLDSPGAPRRRLRNRFGGVARHRPLWLVCVITGVALLWLLLRQPSVALAAGGTITVTVVNGTHGNAPVANQDVVLHVQVGKVHLPDVQASTNGVGVAQFHGLEVGPDAAYDVSADFAHVQYAGPLTTFPAGSFSRAVSLLVWETTSQDPGLRIRDALLVLSQPNAGDQSIGALELYTFENPSTKTYLPTMSSGSGPMGLMRFGLPPGSSAIQPEVGLDLSLVVQISIGFASASPILPGQHQIGFAYRFPYTSHTDTLVKTLYYAADDFRVLAPPQGPTVAGPHLVSAGVATIGTNRYRVWTHGPSAVGSTVTVTLDGLPLRNVVQRLVAAVPRGGVPPVIILPVALIAALVPLRYASRQRPAMSGEAAAHGCADDVLAALADLDDRHDAGSLDESAYQAQRELLLTRALRRVHSSGKQA